MASPSLPRSPTLTFLCLYFFLSPSPSVVITRSLPRASFPSRFSLFLFLSFSFSLFLCSSDPDLLSCHPLLLPRVLIPSPSLLLLPSPPPSAVIVNPLPSFLSSFLASMIYVPLIRGLDSPIFLSSISNSICILTRSGPHTSPPASRCPPPAA